MTRQLIEHIKALCGLQIGVKEPQIPLVFEEKVGHLNMRDSTGLPGEPRAYPETDKLETDKPEGPEANSPQSEKSEDDKPEEREKTDQVKTFQPNASNEQTEPVSRPVIQDIFSDPTILPPIIPNLAAPLPHFIKPHFFPNLSCPNQHVHIPDSSAVKAVNAGNSNSADKSFTAARRLAVCGCCGCPTACTCGRACAGGCGCLSYPGCAPQCMQYMTGYYYYPYGVWFCGPYHVCNTCQQDACYNCGQCPSGCNPCSYGCGSWNCNPCSSGRCGCCSACWGPLNCCCCDPYGVNKPCSCSPANSSCFYGPFCKCYSCLGNAPISSQFAYNPKTVNPFNPCAACCGCVPFDPDIPPDPKSPLGGCAAIGTCLPMCPPYRSSKYFNTSPLCKPWYCRAGCPLSGLNPSTSQCGPFNPYGPCRYCGPCGPDGISRLVGPCGLCRGGPCIPSWCGCGPCGPCRYCGHCPPCGPYGLAPLCGSDAVCGPPSMNLQTIIRLPPYCHCRQFSLNGPCNYGPLGHRSSSCYNQCGQFMNTCCVPSLFDSMVSKEDIDTPLHSHNSVNVFAALFLPLIPEAVLKLFFVSKSPGEVSDPSSRDSNKNTKSKEVDLNEKPPHRDDMNFDLLRNFPSKPGKNDKLNTK